METKTKDKETREIAEESEERVYRPKVNMRLCIGCGDCVVACPINKNPDGSTDNSRTILTVRDGALCIDKIHLCDGCGICIEACLPKAISIEFPLEEEEK